MPLPSIMTLNNYSAVSIGKIIIHFSYNTPIAFATPSTGLVCRVNDWSKTTGKHLNLVQPDHKKRIIGTEFEKQLAELCKE